MHIHASALQILVVFLGVLIAGTGWRILSAKYADSSLGQAMAFVY